MYQIFYQDIPADEDSPNEIIPIAFMLRELEEPDFPENFPVFERGGRCITRTGKL